MLTGALADPGLYRLIPGKTLAIIADGDFAAATYSTTNLPGWTASKPNLLAANLQDRPV